MIISIFAIGYAILSIILGAFVQHGLQDVLSKDQLHTLQIAARYLFYHAIPVLMLVLTQATWQWPRFLPWLFIGTCAVFSGSLLGLVMTGQRLFAYATPLGGLGLLISWGVWGWILYRKSSYT